MRPDAVFDRGRIALAFDMLGLTRSLGPKQVKIILGTLDDVLKIEVERRNAAAMTRYPRGAELGATLSLVAEGA